MRVVRNRSELQEALERARSEADKAFGNPAVFLERYIENPKHIEVQILADQHGNMVHLFERDCSVQRRHQKVVEIAPALALDRREAGGDLRGRAPLDAPGQTTSTRRPWSFSTTRDGNFYFLEVNPRIQVEHTVTELITGIDIVQAQIRIAEGYALSDPEIGIPSQEAVTAPGVCHPVPDHDGRPHEQLRARPGPYHRLPQRRRASASGSTRATAITGAVITPYYDSLLVKVSTWALTL